MVSRGRRAGGGWGIEMGKGRRGNGGEQDELRAGLAALTGGDVGGWDGGGKETPRRRSDGEVVVFK